MTEFTQLGLAAPLLQALATEGYTTPTPIQLQSIPHVLAGRDLLGIAQTGTGKTAAFALPILQRLGLERKPTPRGGCRALVLSPTRELASQIADSFRAYGRHMGLSVTVVFGGVSHGPQSQALRRGVDIVVATPGRLLDHLDQRTTRLDHVEVLVLDEADHMLDLGFIHAIRRLVPMLPKQRQSLFFSATMPKEIGNLAANLLTNPERVQVTPVAATADRVDQRVIMVDSGSKRGLLAELMRDPAFARTLVFTRTKHGADRVVQHLERVGIPAAAIHGNKSQGQRERALDGFKSGRTRILIATDIAARGIDVDNVSHVINFDLPNVPESYVHRIGRTARAGAEGTAISFCAPEERAFLRDIEKLVRRQIPASSHKGSGVPEPEEPRRPHQPHGKPGHRKGQRHGQHGGHALGGHAGRGGHRGQRGERGDQQQGQPAGQPVAQHNGHAQHHDKPARPQQGKPAHQGGHRQGPSGQQPRRDGGIGGVPFMQARPKGGRHAA